MSGDAGHVPPSSSPPPSSNPPDAGAYRPRLPTSPVGTELPQAPRRWRLLGGLASFVLFAASLVVLVVVVRELDAAEVSAAFARASGPQIGLALAFTALSYLCLTGYDWVALPEVTLRKIRYRIAALASFTSYAVSFTLGFPLLTAATVRYWIYSREGLRASEIASLTLIAGFTFWLGMSTILAGVMILAPSQAAIFTRLPLTMNVGVGATLLVAIALYLRAVRGGQRRLALFHWRLNVPGISVTPRQLVLGAADVAAGAAVLYVLLPPEANVAFATMLAAYVFACLLGIASHAPGGLGVFEATMLLGLPGVPSEALVGALLVYRLCYYLLPFSLALVLLGIRALLLRGRPAPTAGPDSP